MSKGYTNFEGQDYIPVSDFFKTRKQISVKLTSKELHLLYDWFLQAEEHIYNSSNAGHITDEQLEQHNELYNKLRKERFNFFKTK